MLVRDPTVEKEIIQICKRQTKLTVDKKIVRFKIFKDVVGLDGNPAIWQHSIAEMLACVWLLCCDSEANKLDI